MAEPKNGTKQVAVKGQLARTGKDLNDFINGLPALGGQVVLPPRPANKEQAQADYAAQNEGPDPDSDDSADEEYDRLVDPVGVHVAPGKRTERTDEINRLDAQQRKTFEALPLTKDPSVPHEVMMETNTDDCPMQLQPQAMFCATRTVDGNYIVNDGMIFQTSAKQFPVARFAPPKGRTTAHKPSGPSADADFMANVRFESFCKVYVPEGAQYPRLGRTKVEGNFFSLTRVDSGMDMSVGPDGTKAWMKPTGPIKQPGEVEPGAKRQYHIIEDSDDDSDDEGAAAAPAAKRLKGMDGIVRLPNEPTDGPEMQVWKFPDSKPPQPMIDAASEQAEAMVIDALRRHGINTTFHVCNGLGKNPKQFDEVFARAIQYAENVANATRILTVLAGTKHDDACMPTEEMTTTKQPMAMAFMWQMAVKCAPEGKAMDTYQRLLAFLEGEECPMVDSLPDAVEMLETNPEEFAEGCRTAFEIIVVNLSTSVMQPDACMRKIKTYCEAMIAASRMKIPSITNYILDKVWDIIKAIGFHIKHERCLRYIEQLKEEKRLMEKDEASLQEMRAIVDTPVAAISSVGKKLPVWLSTAATDTEVVSMITQFVVGQASTDNGKYDGLMDATTKLGDGCDEPMFYDFVGKLAKLFEKSMKRNLDETEHQLVRNSLVQKTEHPIGSRRSALVAKLMKPIIDVEAIKERQAINDELEAAKRKAKQARTSYTQRRPRREIRKPDRFRDQ